MDMIQQPVAKETYVCLDWLAENVSCSSSDLSANTVTGTISQADIKQTRKGESSPSK